GAAATHFAVTPAGGTASAGTPLNFTLTALDAFNNTDPNYAGTVHFSSTHTQAALPANGTLTAGTGTLPVVLNSAPSHTVPARDPVAVRVAGPSGAAMVTATAFDHFLVSAPAGATTGTPINFTVTVVDRFNNPAAGYNGTVHFSSSDPAAVLPADSPLANGS